MLEVILVGGGVGSRMGAAVPKQFLPVLGKPLLERTLSAFLAFKEDLNICMVLPKEYLAQGKALLRHLDTKAHKITWVSGGETRFHSVKNALDTMSASAWVLVHDMVRCLVSVPFLERLYQEACRRGSAVPCLTIQDSVRQITDKQHHAIDRNTLRIIQTPQIFQGTVLKAAFAQPYQPLFTDEASVVEHWGGAVHLVAGDAGNIKITHQEDLAWAAFLLSQT